MAFGFTPKYIQDLPLYDLTPEQFLVLTIEAARKLGWNVGYINETGITAYTEFSMRSWTEEINVKIDGNLAKLKSECTGMQLVDWGKNKNNIKDFISEINWLKSSYTNEEFEPKVAALRLDLISKDKDCFSRPAPTPKGKITSVFAIFKPTQGYFITPILINLNIAIFVLMVLSGVNILLPGGESLLKWGANFRPLTLGGEWWRLITNCFLHIGIFHLLFNMYALLYIGLLLEPYLGKTRFTVAYLLTGIAASMTSLSVHEMTISAGASGAIFGMYGVFLAMLTTNLIEKSARKALLTSIIVFVGYNLMNGVKGGIDNAAHLGGLISGIVIGYSFIPSLKNPDKLYLKYRTTGLLIVFILASSFVAYREIPNDIVTYDTQIRRFPSLEAKALEIYSMPSNTPNDKLLYELDHKGIYNWNEAIKLIISFDDLNLPLEIRTRNRLIKEYCELRIKSYELLYKAVSESTGQYKEQLADYNKQILSKIKEIKGQDPN